MYFSPWALPKDCYSIKANCKALKAQVPSDIRPEIIVPISKTNKAHQSSENEWRGWIWINPWDQGEHSTNKVHTRKMSPIGNTEQNPKTYFLHCWVSAVLKQRTVRVLGIVYIIHGLACPCSSLPEKLSFTSEEWTLCDYIYICGETLWQGLCVYLCVPPAFSLFLFVLSFSDLVFFVVVVCLLFSKERESRWLSGRGKWRVTADRHSKCKVVGRGKCSYSYIVTVMVTVWL